MAIFCAAVNMARRRFSTG
ncbi:hypothetical protein A2U01_0104015, partial [Trifolium medium]|nr:hypothetical protein [Trifolium medium]